MNLRWTGMVFKLLFGNCQRISWWCSWPRWGVRHWRGCSQDIIRSRMKEEVGWCHTWTCCFMYDTCRCSVLMYETLEFFWYNIQLGKRFKVTVNPMVNFFLRYRLSSHVWFHFLHRVLHFAFSFLPKMRMWTVGLPGMIYEESPSSIAFEVLSPDFLFLIRVI